MPLGFGMRTEDDGLVITVPTWRATGDIAFQDDVLEEIARMIGYNNFDFIPPAVLLSKAVNQPRVLLERRVREYLAFQCGLQEVFTYPWVNQRYLAAAGIQPESCLQLSTPPSPDTACLRTSLIPGILATAALNLKTFEEFKIYEMTQVFSPGETHPSEEGETLPLQRRYLAAGLVGSDPVVLFRLSKGILENLPRAVMAEPLDFEQRDMPAWADPKAWLNVLSNGEVIGSMGIVSRKTARAADIKRAQIALFELDMEKIIPLPSRSNRFSSLPLYPLVEQDFSVTLNEDVSWAQIVSLLGSSVKSISFIEEYRGKQIPEGKKSILFRVCFGSEEGTMTTTQIEEKMNSIIKKISRIGGEVRS
jgi:phenylalanyl-tRNA synthetase beta chain